MNKEFKELTNKVLDLKAYIISDLNRPKEIDEALMILYHSLVQYRLALAKVIDVFGGNENE